METESGAQRGGLSEPVAHDPAPRPHDLKSYVLKSYDLKSYDPKWCVPRVHKPLDYSRELQLCAKDVQNLTAGIRFEPLKHQ